MIANKLHRNKFKFKNSTKNNILENCCYNKLRDKPDAYSVFNLSESVVKFYFSKSSLQYFNRKELEKYSYQQFFFC